MTDDLWEPTAAERMAYKIELERDRKLMALGAAALLECGPKAVESQAVPAPIPLLDVLLAGLRAAQPESNCFLCVTSDDERDLCAVHLTRLAAIVGYGKEAA